MARMSRQGQGVIGRPEKTSLAGCHPVRQGLTKKRQEKEESNGKESAKSPPSATEEWSVKCRTW